ncbi:hypothetical protein ACPA2M_26970, partial [Ectopseudomonas chengduensis]
MAQPHAVEVLLRPAVELYTVAVCTGAAILCLVAGRAGHHHGAVRALAWAKLRLHLLGAVLRHC